jgi:hypothetical protein
MAETEAERQAREQREKAAADRTATLDGYEAKHADVHAATIVVLNIKVLMPVVLDRTANNYNRWRALFLVVLGKYALTDHVLTDWSTPIGRRGCRWTAPSSRGSTARSTPTYSSPPC